MLIIPFPAEKCGCGCGNQPTNLIVPVAPQRNHCLRFEQYDPQVRAVPPSGALTWVTEHVKRGAPIKRVVLTGPGDPLAQAEPVLETLARLRKDFPEMELVLMTIGLHADEWAVQLAEKGLSRVILEISALDAEIAKSLFAWIRPARKTLPLSEAVALLLEAQLKAVDIFKDNSLPVEILTTVYPGYNDGQIVDIARTLAEKGVERLLLKPYKRPVNLGEECPEEPDAAHMERLQEEAGNFLETVLCCGSHETTLGMECPSVSGMCGQASNTNLPRPSLSKANVAVVSSSGMTVDLHLGQAYQVLIYGPREDGLACLLGTRPVPEPGGGGARWQELAETLSDCFALLTASAGESPRTILAEHGITVLITEDEIEGIVDLLFGGGKKKKK